MNPPKTKLISNCCNAPVHAEWGDDFGEESKLKEPPLGVTVWQVCNACSQACDVHPNVMDIGKDTVQKIYDLLLERHPEIPCLTHFEEIVEQAISKAKKEEGKKAVRYYEKKIEKMVENFKKELKSLK